MSCLSRHHIFMYNKAAVRKRLIAERSQFDIDKARSASALISDNLYHTDAYITANSIGFYWSVNKEVATDNLLAKSISNGKNCYLPSIDNNSLRFNKIESLDKMQLNKFNIPEPVSGDLIEISKLDLLIMPLVGYTRNGQRIGMGGGYYDRALAIDAPLPKLLGLAYSFQEIGLCEFDSWDIRLNIVVTEKDVIYCLDN